MLYRLLKKVNHSSNTVFSLSSRSYQSGLQSSGFSDEHARPREGSFPAKTGLMSVLSACLSGDSGREKRGHTAVLPGSTVCRIPAHVENDSLDGDQRWAVRIRACCAESASQSFSQKGKESRAQP